MPQKILLFKSKLPYHLSLCYLLIADPIYRTIAQVTWCSKYGVVEGYFGRTERQGVFPDEVGADFVARLVVVNVNPVIDHSFIGRNVGLINPLAGTAARTHEGLIGSKAGPVCRPVQPEVDDCIEQVSAKSGPFERQRGAIWHVGLHLGAGCLFTLPDTYACC